MRTNMSRTASILTAVALLTGAATTSRPAEAAHCGATAVPNWFAYTCFLTPNAQNHFIHVSISSFLTVDVIDVWTNVIVYHGAAGVWGIEKTITGLTNKYYGSVVPRAVGGVFTISND
jgi:uncharacterized membrane protein YhdT